MLLRYWALSLMLSAYVSTSEAQVDTALQKILLNANDTTKVLDLYQLGRSHLYGDRVKTLAIAAIADSIAEQINYKTGAVKIAYLKAYALHFNGEEEDALDLTIRTIETARQLNMNNELASLLNLKGQIHQSQYQLQKALEAIMASLEIIKNIGDKSKEAIAYHSIAATYDYLNETATSKKYLEMALPLFTELEDWYRLGVVYQSLAVITTKEEALGYAKRGLEALLKTEDIQGQGMCYWSIGDAYYSLSELDLALSNYEKARAIFEEIHYPEGSGNIEANIGSLLLEQKSYYQAFPYLSRGIKIAHRYNFEDILPPLYKGLAKYHAHVGNAQLAQQYIDSLDMVKDSLFANEKTQTLIETETRLQTRDKENQIALQQLEIEKAENQRKNLLITSLLAILGLSFLFYYFRSRQLKKQRRIDNELIIKEKESAYLKELDEAKSTFFANVSHEFRTPLTLILGPLDQMRKGIFEGDYSKYYELMYRNGQRLLQLINQLLDLSKLESSKMTVDVAAININRLLKQITAAFESWAAEKHITYSITIPQKETWVLADADKLEKILINLISNALKFTPNNETVSVSVDCEQEGDYYNYKLMVSDTGPGINAKELSNIFDRFYSSGEHHTDVASTGVGLTLTKELVQLLGGTISVESLEGMGSTFKVALSFPKTSTIQSDINYGASVDRKRLSGRIPTNATVHQDLALPKVLIVDDNRDIRAYIRDYLQGDFLISDAIDGLDGMERALNELPDLIITDVMMPGVNGIEFVQQLKSNEITNHIPIIMLTAKAGQADKFTGIEVGADAYLTKPFNSKELKLRATKLIAQRNALRKKYKSSWHIGPEEVKVTSHNEQFLFKVKKAIEENLDNELFGVEDLAAEIGFSRSQLNRKIKALIDQSPSEMIRQFRLTRAKSLLEQQAGTVSEIAYMVGYSNLSYFTKSFKKMYGMLPSDVAAFQNQNSS